MKRIIVAVAAFFLASGAARAQTQSYCPYLTYGTVLTAAQWQYCFQQKQDALGFTPVNKAGDTMAGKLTTVVSTLANAGFNLQPGAVPTTPQNGDMWITASGIFVQINGVTYSLSTSGVSIAAGTSGQLTQYTGTSSLGPLTTAVSVALGGTGNATAATARASSGLNIDEMTKNGDSNYSILSTDRVVATSATFTAPRTWTLPLANSVNAGQSLIVSDLASGVTGTNTLTIARSGSDTINNGSTSVVMSATGGAYFMVSDGVSHWGAQALSASALTAVTAGTGLTGGTITSSGTIALALNSAVLQASPSSPTGTTSSTGVMMGLGSSCKLTPTYSSRVEFEISGEMFNSTLNDQVGVQLRYGSGTAPTNGAAATGTQLSQNQRWLQVSSTGANGVFKLSGIATGLTPGTPYWFDTMAFIALGGTGNIVNVNCTAHEIE